MTNTPQAAGSTPAWANSVLQFWFDELTREDWFSGDAGVDARINERFAELYAEKCASIPEGALQDSRTALAAILLFDQIPRNLFRGSAKAFATDEMALTIARTAVDKGFDSQLGKEEQAFFYMPFEHSETLADGERCVSLFKSLGDEEMIRFAVEHRDILARFGRYPHRNRALNRESTAAEEAFLAEHKGFGQ
ncbi:MAG TPA: DUF924 family protein [Tianweitania sediminis]|nr:DUF924 family protein [Tianweitania sediminis]